MIRMSKLQSRYAALALLVAGAAVVLWSVCYPLVSLYSSQAANLERKQNQIVRYRHVADNQEALDKELALLKRRSPAADYYIAGETPALASAQVQQYLKQVVQKNGGELISTQILAAGDADNAQSTSLKVQLRADVNASWQILYALESSRPMLFIDNLVISARPVRGRTAQDAPTVSLDLSFEMTGYLREGA
jgi:general secretion pathway protein M